MITMCFYFQPIYYNARILSYLPLHVDIRKKKKEKRVMTNMYVGPVENK